MKELIERYLKKYQHYINVATFFIVIILFIFTITSPNENDFYSIIEEHEGENIETIIEFYHSENEELKEIITENKRENQNLEELLTKKEEEIKKLEEKFSEQIKNYTSQIKVLEDEIDTKLDEIEKVINSSKEGDE